MSRLKTENRQLKMNWFDIQNINEIDSPTLVIYLDRVQRNIDKVIKMAGNPARLRPHVKTHKTPQIVDLHLQKDIDKFKCATIAEAEMCAKQGAKSIILAHQLTIPKYNRWIKLIKTFPDTEFITVVDNQLTTNDLEQLAETNHLTFNLFIDVNNGMNRSGIRLNDSAFELCQIIHQSKYLKFGGLHVYDGHIRQSNFAERQQKGENDFQKVTDFVERLNAVNIDVEEVVVGGSPSFPVHANRANVTLSPGTYVFWDRGYGDKFQESDFEHAAVMITRVISVIDDQTVCLDLGHKSIASENPHPRVYFLNCEVEKFLIHSEEHLTIQTPDAKQLKVGDVLYGVPHHICPTVNLTDELTIIENGKATQRWEVVARKRKLTI